MVSVPLPDPLKELYWMTRTNETENTTVFTLTDKEQILIHTNTPSRGDLEDWVQ